MIRLMILVVLGLAHLSAATQPNAEPTKRVEADMGAGCRFAMTLPATDVARVGADPSLGLGGFRVRPLPKSWKSSLGDLYFDLSCRPADDPSATAGLAKLNDKTGLWEKDLDRGFLPPPPTGEERTLLDKATRVINVQAVNAKGHASVVEDTFGDDRHRVATMHFCLFQPPRAICGYGVVGMLRDGRKGDLTPHALKIIRSIQFLPDEPHPQSAEPPAPSSEPQSHVKP